MVEAGKLNNYRLKSQNAELRDTPMAMLQIESIN